MSDIPVPTIDEITGPTVMRKMRKLIEKMCAFAQGVYDKLTETVADVDEAVQEAESASESAQESAQIVSGYNTRLTQAETDITSLGTNKADKTQLTDGSVTKVGTANVGTDTKPIKLVDGVPTAVDNNLVDVSTAQDITAVKTFKNSGTKIKLKRDEAYTSGDFYSPYIDFITDNSDNSVGRIYAVRNGLNGRYVIDIRNPATNAWVGCVTFNTDGSIVWMVTPTRPYASGNTNDVVTIGSLAANPSVIHTTGNESIAGYKTFVNDVVIAEAYNPYFVTQTNNIPSRSALASADAYYTRWEWRAANGDMLGAMQFVHNANSNSTEIQVCSITNGSEYWRPLQ